MEKHSKIYVAGHRGLVGSAIVRRLTAEGYDNLVFTPHKDYDLRDQSVVNAFFEKERPEYVFLSAAKVGGIKANSDYPADFIYDNLMIGVNIIHSAYLYGVKKLLYLGSSCIYPKLCPQPIKEEYLLTGALEPTNEAYALAKISCLKMCEYYRKQYGMDFISAMPTNIYGPNDNFDLETSHVLPALVRKFCLAKWLEDGKYEKIATDLSIDISCKDKTYLVSTIVSELSKYGIETTQQCQLSSVKCQLSIWGTGKARREFLHSDDLADALVFLMNYYSPNGDDGASPLQVAMRTSLLHINVGTGKDITIYDLVMMIKEIVGFKSEIIWDTSKPDGTPQKLLCVEKINQLGWSAKIDLHSGVERMIKEYKGVQDEVF